jgi:hypothetical protein
MSDQQINEFITSLFNALPGWVQALVAFAAGAFGISAWRKGEKDRKMGSNTMEIPIYLLSGPLADAIRKMEEMADDVKAINEKYAKAIEVQQQQLAEQRRQTQLLENMFNDARQHNYNMATVRRGGTEPK